MLGHLYGVASLWRDESRGRDDETAKGLGSWGAKKAHGGTGISLTRSLALVEKASTTIGTTTLAVVEA
jgi:hypothetical protein